jgi:hypothetical protein
MTVRPVLVGDVELGLVCLVKPKGPKTKVKPLGNLPSKDLFWGGPGFIKKQKQVTAKRKITQGTQVGSQQPSFLR